MMDAFIAERAASNDLPSHVALGINAKALSAICDPDINIAIWQRSQLPALRSLDLEIVSDMRFTAAIGTLPDTLAREMALAGYSIGMARHSLATDILSLANHFSSVMNLSRIEVRLEVITTNACYKYHSDWVTARLITTYLGQGTQWLSNEDAKRHRSGMPAESLFHHNIKTGHVAIFKGQQWSNDAPAIHRSPPIEGSGEQRLILVLNPARQSNE
jgi:Protein of unknown function (DUF1826)